MLHILNHSLTHDHRIIIVVITCLFLTGNAIEAGAKKQFFENYKKVIAIDPGHGGNDFGAQGPDGTPEKAVTLNLAQILAAKLKPNYRVVLTRIDDNQVNLDNRTATANHHKADLFISIHTGGSFIHSTSGILIFHYQNFTEIPPVGEGSALSGELNDDIPILWDLTQSRYLDKSQLLARMINTQLSGFKGIEESRVQGAPLAVLQGAGMPSILIEIGYLTNPGSEKIIKNQRIIKKIASAIRRGIDAYFEQNK